MKCNWPACGCAVVMVLGSVVATATKERTADAAGEATGGGKTFELRDPKMAFVRIEPGQFLMGSPADEPSRKDDEEQHQVRLTKPFYLQTTEVSQRQYQAVMGENPSGDEDEERPVENVSWAQAAAFCYELSRREGKRFRLPTEAEWEYAARAGKAGPVGGTGDLNEMAWHADVSGNEKIDSAKLWDEDPDAYFGRLNDNGCRTRAVGSGKPNEWGLRDIQGNVSEWVGDWYADDYFDDEAAKLDPTGPKTSEFGSRAFRGGSFVSDPRNCRLASRDYNVPKSQFSSLGFRVVMEPE